jgi:hypothetical protein
MEFQTRHAYLKVFTSESNTQELLLLIDSLGPSSDVAGLSLGSRLNGFHISFSVVKSLAPNSNRAEISIYNLSQATRKAIASNGLWCELYAGYLNDEQLLFAGEIKAASPFREGPDLILTLECQTDWKLDTLPYSKSFPVGTPVSNVLKDVLTTAKLAAALNIVAVDDTLSSPLVLSNTVEAVFDKLAEMFHFSWSVQDYGFLAIRDNFAFLNSQKIDSLIKSADITPKQNDRATNGFVVNCILNSSFMVGDLIDFSSLYHSARFKIYEIFYNGDTFDGEWGMNIEGFVPGSLIVQPTKTPSFWA